MRLPKLVAATLLLGVSISWAASPQVFSLSGNWSNENNPNGPWSYNQGSTPLPLVPDWTGNGSAFVGCNQPAWAPSNNGGDFLPAFMKANSCTAKDLGTDPHNGRPNARPGDIVVHTVDSANGSPANGVANFLFTLPAGDDGEYEISGFVWDAWIDTGRPQDWELLVNGVEQASGFLSGGVSRSQAQTFKIFATLAAGDTVDLELFEDSTSPFGFFVGVNLSITPIPALSPASLSFGNQLVDTTSAAKTVTLVNNGSATLDISDIAPSGDFTIAENTCGATLAVGKKCKVSVAFAPTSLGPLTGALVFTDSAASNPQMVPLSGKGFLPATLTPSSATYAKRAVGTTSPAKTFTLINNQTETLTGIVITTSGDFAVSATTCTTSLDKKCTISVTFTPTETGTRTGQLSVSDSASNSPQTSTLTGTGK